MPMITVVIILIILQGNPVASHPPGPTPQDSRRNSSEARQPLPRGRRSWRKSASPASGWGRCRSPRPCGLPAPHLPSVMAFPVLPGFGGLTPEGNLLSSSESSRATEAVDSLGPSSHPLPQPPPLQAPAAEPGCPGRI